MQCSDVLMGNGGIMPPSIFKNARKLVKSVYAEREMVTAFSVTFFFLSNSS